MKDTCHIKLVYGTKECSDNALYIQTRFRLLFNQDWLNHSLSRFVLGSVDKTEVLGNLALRSKALGVFAPEYMSGAKTLIYSYFKPDDVYLLTNLGDNCADALYRSSREVVTTLAYEGYMPKMVPEQEILLPDGRLVYYKDYKNWIRTIPDGMSIYKAEHPEEE